MSLVLRTENDTPMSWALAEIVEKSLYSWCMLPLWKGEATVSQHSSTEETIRPLGIDVCRGATYRMNKMGEISDPWGVATEAQEGRLGELGTPRCKTIQIGMRRPSRPYN